MCAKRKVFSQSMQLGNCCERPFLTKASRYALPQQVLARIAHYYQNQLDAPCFLIIECLNERLDLTYLLYLRQLPLNPPSRFFSHHLWPAGWSNVVFPLHVHETACATLLHTYFSSHCVTSVGKWDINCCTVQPWFKVKQLCCCT